MEFSLKAQPLEKIVADALIVAIPSNQQLSSEIKQLDTACSKIISQVIKAGDLGKNLGSTVVLHHVNGIKAQRLLLINSGSKTALNDNEYRQLVRTSLKALEALGIKNVALTLNQLNVEHRDDSWNIEQAVIIASEIHYRVKKITKEKSRKKKQTEKIKYLINNHQRQITN